MQGLFIVATVLVALASSHAAVPGLGQKIECFRAMQPRIYESRILELIEDLKLKLKEGIPDKNIPPLDPFVMQDLHLKLNEKFAKLDWNMTGKIGGLMGFEMTEMKFQLAGFKISFGLNIPKIEGKGTYSIDGAIAELLPVYGQGEFDVLAQDLSITGNAKLGSRGSGAEQTLFLENFSIKVKLGRFIFGVTGLMNDEQLNFLLSKMISDSLPDLIENFNDAIDQVVSAKVTAAADKVLAGMTMADILDMLKPKPATTTAAPLTDMDYTIHCGDY